MSSLYLEFVRQMLRWLALYLLGIGMPEPLAAFVENPEFVAYVAATLSLALAEGGWLITKWKQLRNWLRS